MLSSSKLTHGHLVVIVLSAIAGFLLVSSSLVVPVSAANIGNPNFRVGKVTQVSPNRSPFSPSCPGGGGTLYFNSKDEPKVDVNPTNSKNIIGVYQQDRFSTLGSDGTVAAYTNNGVSIGQLIGQLSLTARAVT